MAERFVLDTASMWANLLELAGLCGWGTLTLDGETIGGSESDWWACLATADESQLRRLRDAAWDAWVDETISPAWEKASGRWFREPADIQWYRSKGQS